MLTIVLTFWIACILVLYTYIGYAVLLALFVKHRERAVVRTESAPMVSILLCASNEAGNIERKLDNLLSLDYPCDRIQILVASDGSTDGTDDIVRGYEDRGVVLLRSEARVGKPSNLSRLEALAIGDILVFCDVRQLYHREAIRRLVAPFADPTVGCVSGALVPGSGSHAIGEGAGFYRRYEQWLREMEGRLDTMLGAAGAIYALRRELFKAPAPDTILDDFVIPMSAVAAGYRTVLEPRAIAYDDAPKTGREEFSRKARTLAGNYQTFVRFPLIWMPGKSRVAWQIISHKGLRLLCPLFLLAAFLSSAALASRHPLYTTAFGVQCAFYALAAVAAIMPLTGLLRKLVGVPYAFVVMNLAAVVGFWRFLRGRQSVTWERSA